jgi:hypothetical protein
MTAFILVVLAVSTPPYPPSPVIAAITFHDETVRTLAPGSDIWPLTWGTDGHQYTAFGDGGGFGGSNRDGRVSLGVARIEGEKHNYVGRNIAGGKDAPHAAPFTGKSEGILALGNTLYLWRDGDASSLEYFKFCELWRSDDLGANWTATGVRYSTSGGDFPPGDQGIFAPAFCQFGPGYSGARDNFVYIYAPDSIDPTHWNVRVPGRINLLRVPRDKIESKADYRFFAGLDPSGVPRWTSEPAKRQPTWQDAAGGTHRIAVSYNPGLRRYLLSTITNNRQGWFSLYDAPQPWGPWTHIHTEHNPQRWGTLTILFTFANNGSARMASDSSWFTPKTIPGLRSKGRFNSLRQSKRRLPESRPIRPVLSFARSSGPRRKQSPALPATATTGLSPGPTTTPSTPPGATAPALRPKWNAS